LAGSNGAVNESARTSAIFTSRFDMFTSASRRGPRRTHRHDLVGVHQRRRPSTARSAATYWRPRITNGAIPTLPVRSIAWATTAHDLALAVGATK